MSIDLERKLNEYLVQLRIDSAEIYKKWKLCEETSILDAPTKFWKGYYNCMLDIIIELEDLLYFGEDNE